MKRKHGTTAAAKKPFKAPRKTGDYQAGRELHKQPAQELKAFDVTSTSLHFDVIATPPPFSTSINCPINGAELYQRVGRKMYMKSLHLRGFVNNIATSVQDIGRIIVYYDSQPNGVAPTIQQLLQDSTAAALTSALSEINLQNRQRFKILRDMPVLLPACTNNAGVLTNLAYPQTSRDNKFHINEFIPLNGLEVVFNGTNGGTVADITSGAIGIVCPCDFNAAAWSFIFTTRLRYYD